MDRVQTRPGGRSAQVRDAVHAALRDALESGDISALSVDRLAAASGVHRSTIYRRWPSTAALVGDLLASLTPVEPHLPDTGDLMTDLQDVARRVVAVLSTPLADNTVRLAAGSRDPDLIAAVDSYWSAVLDHTAKVIRRAQARGAATEEIDAIDAIESLLGPIYLRMLVTRHPLADEDLCRLAERTARMLRP